jgi:hypothetical protein
MNGVYTASGKISALAAAKTLMYLTAPASRVVELIAVTVTNESNATNFQMEIAITSITTLGTPTATAVTPQKHESGDQASGTTTKLNVTASEPTYAGTATLQEGAPSLTGFRWEPQPEERIYIAPGASYGIRMITTPTSNDCDVRVTFREIG